MIKKDFDKWAFGEDYHNKLQYGELAERWNNLHGDINIIPTRFNGDEFDFQYFFHCVYKVFFVDYQPERSKREDSNKKELINKIKDALKDARERGEYFEIDLYEEILNYFEMRCSEHCGNTVRDK